MIFLETLVLFAAVVVLALVCGYGIVRLLLPDEYQQEFAWVLMPPIGYCFYSWLAFTLSGTFNLSGNATVLFSLGVVVLLAGIGFFIHKRKDLGDKGQRQAIAAWLLPLPLLLVMLWPLFYVGAETYLAAVNPDYIATFFDLHHLKEHSLNADAAPHENSYSYFATLAGNLSKSARFASATMVALL